MLFLSIFIAVKRSLSVVFVSLWLSVIIVGFSSVFLWFLYYYFLLASTVASMTRKCSSDLVFILLPSFGILKLRL